MSRPSFLKQELHLQSPSSCRVAGSPLLTSKQQGQSSTNRFVCGSLWVSTMATFIQCCGGLAVLSQRASVPSRLSEKLIVLGVAPESTFREVDCTSVALFLVDAIIARCNSSPDVDREVPIFTVKMCCCTTFFVLCKRRHSARCGEQRTSDFFVVILAVSCHKQE